MTMVLLISTLIIIVFITMFIYSNNVMDKEVGKAIDGLGLEMAKAIKKKKK